MTNVLAHQTLVLMVDWVIRERLELAALFRHIIQRILELFFWGRPFLDVGIDRRYFVWELVEG